MSDLLARDAAALHRALERDGDRLDVSLHRSTLEFVAALVDARSQGEEVVVARNQAELTPAQAAKLLGVSRPQVRRLMDRGVLPSRMVGSHHRIPLSAVQSFRESERVRMMAGMADLADLQNELGLTD